MKKAFSNILILAVCFFIGALLGFWAGRNTNSSPVYIQPLGSVQTAPEETAPTGTSGPERININTATVEQLQALPGIGEAYALRIVEYREKNGPFQSVGELAYIEGIGEKRLESLWDLVTTGG